jgi:hypothetical protein
MAVFRSLLIALLALPLLGYAGSAFAQSATPIVVSSCGSQTLTASRNASPSVDTTGKLCTSSTGGGGGAVTIASGGVASGAYSAGSISNGADVVEGTITTGHGCLIAGYTVIGCLGQIDDDIKGPIAAGSNVIGGVTLASGALAAGSVSAGAYVSGSILSGAYASGSISSGADVTEGTTSPTVTCSTTWTVNGCLSQLHTDATSAIPAGANVIGVTGVAQASTTSGQSGELIQGAVTTANPADTTAQTSPLSLTITGALRTVQAPGTMETCSSGNVANSAVACTLAQSAGHTTFIAGLIMSSNGATAALGVTCTLTSVITGTMSFSYVYPAIATVTNQPTIIQFNPPIPASAAATTIVGSCPASGTGGTIASLSMWGFQQ